jgi:hypothetical protein
MVLAAWLGFWLFLTVRTVSRERARVRRQQLKQAND